MLVVADERFMHLAQPRLVGGCVPFGTRTPTCCPFGQHSQKHVIGSDDAVAVKHAGYRSTNAIEVNSVAVAIEPLPASMSAFKKSLLRLRRAKKRHSITKSRDVKAATQ